MRLSAARDSGALGRVVLERLTLDERVDERVRLEALEALPGRLPIVELLPALERAARSRSLLVAVGATRALGQVEGGSRALGRLASAPGRVPVEIRVAAVDALLASPEGARLLALTLAEGRLDPELGPRARAGLAVWGAARGALALVDGGGGNLALDAGPEGSRRRSR